MLGVRKWGNDGHCMRLGGWLVRTGIGRRNPPQREDRPHSYCHRCRWRWGDRPRRWWSRHAMHAGSQACRHMPSFPTRIWFWLKIWKQNRPHTPSAPPSASLEIFKVRTNSKNPILIREELLWQGCHSFFKINICILNGSNKSF